MNPPVPKADPYENVRCLLLYWEHDDLGCKSEVFALERLLKTRFRFCVEIWAIPRHGYAQFNLRNRLIRFKDHGTSDNELLIVYYAGHGWSNSENELPQLELVANDRDNPPSSVSWNALQFEVLFDTCKDTLVVLDCCYAAAAIRSRRQGRKDVLAACVRETTTPGPGTTSFTHHLMRALKSFEHPFTVRELYDRMKHWTVMSPMYDYYPKITHHEIILTPKSVNLGSVSDAPHSPHDVYASASPVPAASNTVAQHPENQPRRTNSEHPARLREML